MRKSIRKFLILAAMIGAAVIHSERMSVLAALPEDPVAVVMEAEVMESEPGETEEGAAAQAGTEAEVEAEAQASDPGETEAEAAVQAEAETEAEAEAETEASEPEQVVSQAEAQIEAESEAEAKTQESEPEALLEAEEEPAEAAPDGKKGIFSDVQNPSRYYYEPVCWGHENGIIAGYSDGTFRPGAVCAREHIITFLWRYAGQPEPEGAETRFSDVPAGKYYFKPILWAEEKRIANGCTDGTFRPSSRCERGHVAAFLYRYAMQYGTEPRFEPVKVIPAVDAISPDTKLPSFETDYYYQIVAKGNQAFSVSADTVDPRSGVVLWEKSSGTFDKWIFIRLKENTYCVLNAASGFVLDDPDFSAENSQPMQLWKMNRSKAQQWHLVDTGDGDGSIYLENASSGLFLDIRGGKYKNGTVMQQYADNRSAAQKFFLQKAKVTFNGSKYVGGYKLAFRNGKIVYDRVQNMEVASKTNQIILVEAEPTGSKAVVSMHEKSAEGIWEEVIRTDTAYIGKNGLGKTKQGDNKTPVGVFYPDKAFGIKPDPGCKVPYTKVDDTNYWVGDNSSSRFNTFVTTREFTDFRKSAGEHLIEYTGFYNYCLNIGYNTARTPYKGSCIFLHCIGDTPYTHGCIAVPEATMVSILRRFRMGCAMVIK